MPAPNPSHTQTVIFRCGGGLSSTSIVQTIKAYNSCLSILHNSRHEYFVFDEIDKLSINAQQSLRSTLDLKRCMFFFTTNYLSKVDQGIVNRCHLIEMNQASSLSAYIPLGQRILQNMSVGSNAVTDTTLAGLAANARGSLREFTTEVVMAAITAGGVMP